MVVKFKIYLCQKVERREIRYKVKQQGNVRTRNKLTEEMSNSGSCILTTKYVEGENLWQYFSIQQFSKFFSKVSFILLKIQGLPSCFIYIYLYILHLLIFIMLEIKTNTFKIFICFKITIINPLPFSIRIFYVKNNYFSKQKI